MTTQNSGSGHRSARPRPLRRHALLGSCLLGFCALPAFAQPLAPTATDPLDMAGNALAFASGTAPGESTALPDDRSLHFSHDLKSLLASQPIPGPGTTTAQPAPTGRVQSLLQRALALLGTPYRWGGTDPDGGFDCSGLVKYVFRSALGIELPRVSREMATEGELIRDRTALTAGDLVFFSRRGKRVDHVGIYVGNGQFLHAPRTGRDVTVSSLSEGYWSRKFLQARRVAGI